MNQEYGDLKIVWHDKKLKSFFEKKVTAPIHIRIKPTNKCNHNCFYCVYNKDYSSIHSDMSREDEIPREKMIEVLKDLKEMGVKAVTYSGGGEPLFYPFIEEILEKTKEHGINFAMITNGQLLDGKKAELLSEAHWIRISSDSSDPKTFASIRGKPEDCFNKLSENIKKFSSIKNSKCVFGINFVVHEKNKDKLYESAKFYRDLGVEYVRFSPVWNPNFLKYHEPFKSLVLEQIEKARQELQSEKFRVLDTFKKDFESSNLSKRNYSKCFFMQVNPVIAADQKVYFCHNKAYDSGGVLGSIKDKSFKELWFSPEVAEIFEKFNPEKGCLHQCTNDPKNILIKDILDSLGYHINFI